MPGPAKKHQARGIHKEKVTVYLGPYADEIEQTSVRLNESKSSLLVRAWAIAKERLSKYPAATVEEP
jgi:hypothetical protein